MPARAPARLIAVVIAAGLAACGPVKSSAHPESIPSQETIERGGYQLTFINNATAFNPTLGVLLIETFFYVYPRMVAQYNPDAPTKVTLFIDPTYDGAASTEAGVVRLSPAWFHDHPKDLDIVTHEVMHIVQSYPPNSVGWITEGIADYVRHQLGTDNAGSGWTLPALAPTHHYTTSDRVTARFFVWLDAKIKPGLIKTLDAAMRAGTYSDAFWTREAGVTIDTLWGEYVANPALP